MADRAAAIHWLKKVGYYRLSAYFLPFKIRKSDLFSPGSSIEKVVALYQFDARLRLLVMQAIDLVEIAVRASVTYHFAHIAGPFGHMDPNNFAAFVPSAGPGIPAQGFDHTDFRKRLEREIEQSVEDFVGHYRAKYSLEPHLPIWMATELMTLGMLSKIMEYTRKSLGKRIAADFQISQSQLTSWVRTIAYVRNLCAHHCRLWNRELSLKPELLREFKNDGAQGERMYCVFLLLAHLIRSIQPKSAWKVALIDHLKTHPFGNLSAMQFPENGL